MAVRLLPKLKTPAETYDLDVLGMFHADKDEETGGFAVFGSETGQRYATFTNQAAATFWAWRMNNAKQKTA